MTEKQQPGTRARLIREALERHPESTPQELARLLNEQHQGLNIEFQEADVRHVKQILGEPVPKSTAADAWQPLFSDRIPPMREHENPALEQLLTANSDERTAAAETLTAADMQHLHELVRKAGSVRQLIRILQSLENG